MQNQNSSLSTPVSPSGHMAWCALVALRLAMQENPDMANAQANLFLTRWLATALKQRRFPREATPDIEWLLKQGRAQGVRAGLPCKCEYLWHSCSGTLGEQNDLFRLSFAIEAARLKHWNCRMLSEREWERCHQTVGHNKTRNMAILRSSLDMAFDNEGNQIAPFNMKLTGDEEEFLQLLEHSSWSAQADKTLPGVYQLQA